MAIEVTEEMVNTYRGAYYRASSGSPGSPAGIRGGLAAVLAIVERQRNAEPQMHIDSSGDKWWRVNFDVWACGETAEDAATQARYDGCGYLTLEELKEEWG